MGESMPHDIRALIQDTLQLLQETPSILASPEDALFFRSLAKKKPTASLPPVKPSPVILHSPSPPPLQIPIPEVIRIETPLPPPPPTPAPVEWRSDTKIAVEPLNFTILRSLFQKTAPQVTLVDQLPSDDSAKRKASRWKTKSQACPISVLSFGEPPAQKALLIEIVKAIDVYFGPARLVEAETIEKEKQWDSFLTSEEIKLVISCDYTLWQLKDLMSHYKEIPKEQKRMLKNTPLFLLPDLSLYLKDPLLKRSLWKALCNKLSS